MRSSSARACGLLLVGFGLLLATPASGWGAARVTLTPAAGQSGSSAVLAGSGFAAHRRIRVSAAGMGTQVLRSSRHGTFVARLTVRGHGWVRLVSRGRHERVVNRFHVLGQGGGDGVVETASGRGPRARFSPGTIVAGGALHVHGAGYRRGARLRLSGLGPAASFSAGRAGGFNVTIPLPASVRPGALRVSLSGGGVRFRVQLRVVAAPTTPVIPKPAPTPVPTPPRTPPHNVSAPVVTGTAWSGEVLTGDNGVWTATGPIEYAYAWQRCDASGAACAAIRGATAPHYTVSDADLGHRLRIAVTATSGTTAATATSLPTDVVTPTPGVAQPPSLPTTAQEGKPISVTPATFTGPAPTTVTFQWQRCTTTCVNIGAGLTSYTVTTADVGARLQVVETATWSAKTLELTSNKTDPVKPAVTPSGTIALWHMDDLGTTMADSAGSHVGTLHAVTTGLPGFAGTAFGFNGANSYVTVPVASDLSPVDQNVALTIRMKTTVLPPPTTQDWDLIRSAGGYYDGDEYKMEYAPDGTAHCAFKGNGATGYKEVVSGGPPLNDGNWHTITCVKTPNQVQTVVDGVVYAKYALIGTITITKGILIGAHPSATGTGASEFFNGALDEASLQFSAPGS